MFTLHFISLRVTQLSGAVSTCQLVEETSVLSGNISDKQTQCYDRSEQPKHGTGVGGGDGEEGEGGPG